MIPIRLSLGRRFSPAWLPIFDGEAASYSLSVVEAVLAELPTANSTDRGWGAGLLTAYLGAVTQDRARLQAAMEIAETIAEESAVGVQSLSLYGGISGVAWLCAHIHQMLGTDDDDFFEDIDRVLIHLCALGGNRHGYDLISGYVGIGVYFLERLPHHAAVQGLHTVVSRLTQIAEIFEGHSTWRTPPDGLPAWQRAKAPLGYYNLGTAHGVPGVVGLLAEMKAASVWESEYDPLLLSATGWVLRHGKPDGSFPPWVAIDGDAMPGRIAWCYGSPGAIIPLLHGAIVAQRDEQRNEILLAASRVAGRHDSSQTIDAGLCHGAAGNGHLFNRLFQATRRQEYRAAAQFWLNRALGLRRHGIGIGGYQAWLPSGENRLGEPSWQDDPGFLTGSAGVALALLAATSHIEPLWDRLLLARLPVLPD